MWIKIFVVFILSIVAHGSESRLLYRPAGLDDESFELRLFNKAVKNGTYTTIASYRLDGTLAHQQDIFHPFSKGMSFDGSTHLVDINGDFRPDLVRIGHNRYVYVLNKSSRGQIGWAEPQTENPIFSSGIQSLMQAGTWVRSLVHKYDELGRLREIKMPSGDAHRVNYDKLDRKSSVTHSAIGELRFIYHNASTRLEKKLFADHEEHYRYDDTGRLSGLNEFEFKYNGPFISEVISPYFTKQFNVSTRRLIEKSGASIEIESKYDHQRRLSIQRVQLHTKHFNYDEFGRLESIQVEDQLFQIKRNKLGKIASVTLPAGGEFKVEYDVLTGGRRGFHTPVGSLNWYYDSRGLISDINAFSSSNEWRAFHYDYHDDRSLRSTTSPFHGEVPKRSDGGEAGWIRDENKHAIAKYQNGKLTHLKFDGVSLLDNHTYQKLTIEGIDIGILVDGRFKPVLFDQVGSVVAFDNFFSVPTPYGVREQSFAWQEFLDFAGQGRDRDTGLVLMGEREYDPQTAQFTSPDLYILESPEKCVTSPQECDLYSYARRNPLMYTDTSGRFADVILDLGFTVLSAYDFIRDPSFSNAGAFGLDVLSAAAPFVTGLGRIYKGAEHATSTLLETKHIRFTHDMVSPKFMDGRSVQELADALKSGKTSPLQVKPIRLFEQDGLTFTLDNRRLLAAHLADVKVNAIPATVADIMKEFVDKMTTLNGGKIVGIR